MKSKWGSPLRQARITQDPLISELDFQIAFLTVKGGNTPVGRVAVTLKGWCSKSVMGEKFRTNDTAIVATAGKN